MLKTVARWTGEGIADYGLSDAGLSPLIRIMHVIGDILSIAHHRIPGLKRRE